MPAGIAAVVIDGLDEEAIAAYVEQTPRLLTERAQVG
jgi:hypothetical protein